MIIKVTILSINQMKKKISFVEVNVLDFSSYNKTDEILNNSIESNSNNSESSIYNHSDERDESDDCI